MLFRLQRSTTARRDDGTSPFPLPQLLHPAGLAPLLAHWAAVTGATSPRDTSALAERLWRRVRDRVCVATLAAAGAAAPLPAALAACVWVASKALDARAAVPPAAALLALAGGARCEEGQEKEEEKERKTAAGPPSSAASSSSSHHLRASASNFASRRNSSNSTSFRGRPCRVMAAAELHVLSLLDWKPLDGWVIGGGGRRRGLLLRVKRISLLFSILHPKKFHRFSFFLLHF